MSSGYFEIKFSNVTMSEGTPNHNPDFPMQSMSVRLSDVWVVTVTYPKCGTTQTQKMVWQIVHKVKIDKEKKISNTC